MKRSLIVVVCLALLLPTLAICVSASTSYTFYRFEPAALYAGTSDFYPDDENPMYFRYDGLLPEGKYKISVLGEIDGQDCNTMSEGDGINITSEGFSGSVPASMYVDGVFTESVAYDLDIFFEDGSTYLSVWLGDAQIIAGIFTVAHFELVDDVMSLTDYVTAESMDAILDEVVALIPVTLAVIVGYIGLRKAISWLLSMIRSS